MVSAAGRAAAQPPPSQDSPRPARNPNQPPPPGSAAEALDRASAAYEFGDLHQMVDLSGMVAEGAVPGSDDQRAQALRLFGIGLYLSGRRDGAERAFVDLLRLRPDARLDPTVTRPEVVAFFRDVRRRHRPKKYRALALLPPLGQFQNDTPRRGWLIAGLEAATLGATVATFVVLSSNTNSQQLCTIKSNFDPGPCERLKVWHYISAAAFAATYAAGVIDGLLGFDRGDDDPELSFTVFPNGAAFRMTF